MNTYINKLPTYISDDGKVHTNLNLTFTKTGRLSSDKPNLQNIPAHDAKFIKRLYVPAEGNAFINLDYSQLELRVLAMLSGDPVMEDVYKKGDDIHTRTAQEVFGITTIGDKERFIAKKINFGIVYGIGSYRLASLLSIPSDEAKSYISNYFKKYRGVDSYIRAVTSVIKKRGYIRSVLGRYRRVPEVKGNNHELIARAIREGINFTISSPASDLTQTALSAMVNRVFRNMGFDAKVVLTVHDSILIECPISELKEVCNVSRMVMEKIDYDFVTLPLKADVAVGFNYCDVIDYDESLPLSDLVSKMENAVSHNVAKEINSLVGDTLPSGKEKVYDYQENSKKETNG